MWAQLDTGTVDRVCIDVRRVYIGKGTVVRVCTDMGRVYIGT